MTAAMLTLTDVSLNFGGIKVLNNVSTTVAAGSIFGLVGPNGAGKTSLFNCISGLYQPSSGSVKINDTELIEMRPHKRVRLGLARTFQHAALQPDSTALENILLGGHIWGAGGVISAALRMPWARRSERELIEQADRLLEQMNLSWARDMPASELSPGHHKNLEICRAMLARPSLLLLDEPAAGLSHKEVEELIANVRELRDSYGVTIILVEHNMSLVSKLCDRVMVLDHGSKVLEGTAENVKSDPRVIEVYLGAGI